MSDKLSEEQKAMLEKFRSQKDEQGTISSLVYALLKEADPRLVEHVEHHAAVVLHAGQKMGQELARADMDPARREDLRRRMRETAMKINTSIVKDKDKEE